MGNYLCTATDRLQEASRLQVFGEILLQKVLDRGNAGEKITGRGGREVGRLVQLPEGKISVTVIFPRRQTLWTAALGRGGRMGRSVGWPSPLTLTGTLETVARRW